MTLNPNQFSQSVVQGMVDLRTGAGQTVACVIDVTSAGSLVAGTPVKVVNSVGGVPKVVECAADTDDAFGYLVFNKIKNSFSSGDAVEVAALRGTVLYLAANGAIARNANVGMVISLATPQVYPTVGASAKRIVGKALDEGVLAGDLIRVVVDLPGALA